MKNYSSKIPLPSTEYQNINIVLLTEYGYLGEKSILRCCFLPDCSSNSLKGYIEKLLRLIGRNKFLSNLETTTSLNWTIISLPNIHELNDKRYEIRCLNYIRDLYLSQYDVIVADASSCEAILRYCETESLLSVTTTKLLVLIDSPDIYTAGERHGRQFRGSLIAEHCPAIGFIATSPKALVESKNLVGQIYSSTAAVEVRQVLADEPDMEEALLTTIARIIIENSNIAPI